MMMVGAGTVQTCTQIMYGTKGFGHVADFLKGLDKYLADHDTTPPKDIIGMTLPQILTWDKVDRESKHISTVDKVEVQRPAASAASWCFYDAITYDADKKAQIDPALCDGCGLCPSLCPEDAISMEGEVFLGDFR